MRISFFKSFLFFCIVFLVLISVSTAGIIRSTGNGNWEDDDTWDLNRKPTHGDEIIIDINHIVTINTTATLNGVTIAIRGNLRFRGVLFVSAGQLDLDSNSTVVVEDGGQLTTTFFSQWFNEIEIGDNVVWAGDVNGNITEETTLDSTGSTPGTPPDYIPLPIELIAFNTQLSGSVVEVEWATATELNNDFFTIERSVDGREWSIIGELVGGGDSHVRLDYQFVDYNPMPGLSYYRLKQTDFDGQFEYFDPSVVLYEPDNLFKVFPNPVQNVLNLTTSSNLENAVIVIKNLNGQQEQVLPIVNSHQAEMDVSGLPPGVYVLEIVFPESTLTKRILKK